ncbi:hypothetical protein MYY11_002811, partial [Enterococcus faecium]|nr:hypothetical protein [Enterococcus faecium]
ILGITFVTVGSAISPIENVFADDQSTTIISQENTEFNKYYNDLSDSKKVEFKNLVEGANLSKDEQLQILKEKYTADREPNLRWKTAVIKK